MQPLITSTGEKYRFHSQVSRSAVYLGASTTTVSRNRRKCRRIRETGKIAIKVKRNHDHQFDHELGAYKYLKGVPGIPLVHGSGRTEHHKFIVMERLGPDLNELRAFCKGSFSLKTTLALADQILSRIEDIHGESCAHGDIKPENLAIGHGKCSQLLYVINFSSAKYPEPQTLGSQSSIGNVLCTNLCQDGTNS
jgi:serine/threonine protein kinase